jgi:hypothetical protein
LILIRKLRTFISLSTDERLLAFEALLLPVALQWGFRACGVARTQSRLRNWAAVKAAPASTLPPESVIRMASRAQGITRRLVGLNGTCLQRSMTLWAILAKRGVNADLRVGFRKHDDAIEGHAWVEYRGQPINEAASVVSTYTVTPGQAAFDLWAAGVRPV